MSYSGVVFDLDGTLLNTVEDLANSMNCVLKRYGFPVHPTEKYRNFIGNGTRNLTACALPEEECDKKKISIYLTELETEYAKRWSENTKPYPGINELIYLLQKSGIKMFVLSNKPHEFTEMVIDEFFGLEYFDLVYGARMDVPKKPDPYSALEIARLSGIAPADFLYLGDSEVDMQTANAAGMFAVGAAWGFRDKDKLWMNGAKAVIENPWELLGMME